MTPAEDGMVRGGVCGLNRPDRPCVRVATEASEFAPGMFVCEAHLAWEVDLKRRSGEYANRVALDRIGDDFNKAVGP